MTLLIRPNNERKRRNTIAVSVVTGVLVLSTFIPVAICYANYTGIKYEIAQMEQKIDQENARNTEIKSKLFYAIDPNRASQVATEKGLVEEKNPRWVFASM